MNQPLNVGADRKVVRQTVSGSPFLEIVSYAKENQAKENQIDLIAIGTHGRTAYHIIMGSVAEKVVRHATCPVLTVRKNGHQFVAFDAK